MGALMPPLVPPTFEEMMLRLTTLTSPGIGRLRLVLRKFVHVDVAQRRELVEHRARSSAPSPADPPAPRAWASTGAFSSGFSGFGGGGGGGGGGGSITNCTTRSGNESVFTTILCRGRKGMSTAMIANTMARLRRMARKRRSISSDGDHGNS